MTTRSYTDTLVALGRAYADARMATCGPEDDGNVDANDPSVADAINAAWTEVERLYAEVREHQQSEARRDQ